MRMKTEYTLNFIRWLFTVKIKNRIKCFWYGHKVPEKWLEYENELVDLPIIPCERCDCTKIIH
ncbi:hypothetical protein LCGC14_2277380 [marine sediment metagenome]|uniref:Uncharacterized protein n=1 Tax=marine sediment metagenome TaxID=412755 RepID=A0A0F9FQG2_9ZZZZ